MPRGIPLTGRRQNRAKKRRAQSRPVLLDDRQLYSVPEYAAATDQSVAAAWDDVYRNRVRSIRTTNRAGRETGRRKAGRVRILGAAIIERIQLLAEQQEPARNANDLQSRTAPATAPPASSSTGSDPAACRQTTTPPAPA